ncbi:MULTISPECIES: SGNH/GDSL hydrolase family protein [Bacteria]
MPDAARRPRVRVGVVWAMAAAVVAAAVIGAWQPWQRPTPASDVAGGAGLQNAGTDASAPAALTIPPDATVLVFGDSWTYGSAASAPTLGYAYELGRLTGWTTIVDGVRGSGYLKPGIDGPSFGERIAALDPELDPDLIIVQGSINDRLLAAKNDYAGAVNAAWDALTGLYPDASIVVLGPAPQVLPVESGTALIDSELSRLAAERGWWYISPIHDTWIVASNYFDVIDTGVGRNHPSTAGHAYLAERLAQALAERMAVVEAVAETPAPTEG